MLGIGRRDVLRGAVFGPVILAAGQIGKMVPELGELDGREIHKIGDLDSMTPLEREHLIKIDFPAEVQTGQPFKMTVSVPNHLMAKRHYISSMRIFLDRALVTYTTLAPTWQMPELTYVFTFDRGSRIDAVVDCSLHGLWGRAVPITIRSASPVPISETIRIEGSAAAGSSDSALAGSSDATLTGSSDATLVGPSTDSTVGQ